MKKLLWLLLIIAPFSALGQTFSGTSGGDIFILPPFRWCMGADNGQNVCLTQSANQAALLNGQFDFKWTERTVALLPLASLSKGRTYRITDGASSSDCTSGGGSTSVVCTSNGTIWAPFAGGGSAAAATTEALVNCSATGTTLNEGVELSSQVVNSALTACGTTASASSTSAIGICASNCGASGTAQIAYQTFQSCVFDNQTVIGDVAAPSINPGQCTDIGAVRLPGVESMGRIASLNSGSGLATINLGTMDMIASGGSNGSGSVSQCNTSGGISFHSAIGTIVVCDPNATLDGNGKLTAKQVVVAGTGPGTVTLQTGAAPANPASGNDLLYANSTSGLLNCLTSTGANCLAPTSSSFTGSPWLDFTSTVGGGVCDNSTDDTAAFNAALVTLNNQGGGTLIIPVGKTCKIAGQITFPNDAAAPPAHQNPIRITSFVNPSADNRGVQPSNAAGILNLTFNAANAKILTFGAGYLEIDHVSLIDTASDCAAFLMTTSTTLNVHENIFSGTGQGAAACNDAVIFGGTGTSLTNTVASPFQGYFSHETRNYFNKMRRIALLQTYANGIEISFNHVTASSGSNLANGASIESVGDVSNSNVGNKFLYNLFEQSGSQVYSIKLTSHSNSNQIIGNDCYDPTAIVTLACVRIESGNSFNRIVDTFTGGANYLSDADGNNTFETEAANQYSVSPNGLKFTSGTNLLVTGGGISGYNIKDSGTNDEFYEQIFTGSFPKVQWWIKPAGGTAESVFSIMRTDANQKRINVEAVTNAFLENNGSGDFKFGTNNAGAVAWVCGGSFSCHNFANAAGSWVNNNSVGTVPFVITSTTPVPNLSISGVASTSQKAESAADASVVAFTPPAVVGSYRIRFVLSLSAANTATLGWTATWTDSNGNAQTPTNLALFQTGVAAPALTFTTSTAGNYYGYMDIDVNNAAAAITVKLTFAGTSFTGKASANIERLQ